MADADHLLSEFVAADRAGSEPDPLTYLARIADEAERARLEDLLDEYLASAPRRPFDAAAFAASPARAVTDDLARVLLGRSGTWPTVLPALRHRAQLRRAEVVARLAAALGAEAQAEKVGAYYHAMEQGTLRAAGVSRRVLDALGAIVGESAERLREAGLSGGGEVLLTGGPAHAPAAPAAFARVAEPDPELDAEDLRAAVGGALSGSLEAHDFVDDLFTAGESGDA